jgi:hypothetical protein
MCPVQNASAGIARRHNATVDTAKTIFIVKKIPT